MVAPLIGSVVVGVLVYLAFAALLGPTAGVLALVVLGAIGFLAWLGMLIVSAR